MVIMRININNFLVFRGEFTVNFCPGVNVLIGGNGTGKTTLLKCLYGSIENNKTSRYFDLPLDSMDDVYIHRISIPYESPLHGDFNVNSFSPIVLYLSSLKNSDEEDLSDHLDFSIYKKSVFIPNAEMLSHSKGLLALCNERKMPFDQTEIDILAKAQLPETHEIKPNAAKVLDKIKTIIGGEVIYVNDMFYTQKENDEKIPFTLEASGFKKIGLLWKLLRNGLLEKDTVLLWDEPENSLNPELVSMLVDVLLELSRNGVQIFIATHSEIFASYFAANRKNGDEIMFTSLYKDGEFIKVNTSDRFDLLEPNSLTAEPVKLYEKEIGKVLDDND